MLGKQWLERWVGFRDGVGTSGKKNCFPIWGNRIAIPQMNSPLLSHYTN